MRLKYNALIRKQTHEPFQEAAALLDGLKVKLRGPGYPPASRRIALPLNNVTGQHS
jgi:hypothetical protein